MNLGIYARKDAERWMNTRMRMFEDYLLKSIQLQTCQNFTFVLCFDERTPDAIVSKYDYCDRIEIAFCQPKVYIPTLNPSAQWLITSRIDSDDFYFKDFVQTIQDNFTPHTQILDIDYFQWSKGNVYGSGRTTANSPLITLIEPWENALGVYCHEHTYMPDYWPARKINENLAVQTIHSGNIINVVHGELLPYEIDGPGGYHRRA